MIRAMNPNPLQEGDIIGLVSPSSPLVPNAIEPGIQFLEQNGFKIKLGNHIYDADRFLAGKDKDRAKDIMNFFEDPDIKAIIATRGGQGSQRLLPLLDYKIISANPKKLVGFSDTTALQLGLLRKTGLITYTGYTLANKRNALVEKTLLSCLLGTPYQITEGVTVHSGIAKGPLVGGNLTLLTNLMGTPYQPDFTGCILLLEEVGIEPHNIDGMFSQLALAGIFDQVAGIIIGQFENCTSKESNPYMGTVEDVINEWLSSFNMPCIKDFPYGHGNYNCVLPVGASITLDADKRSVTCNI